MCNYWPAMEKTSCWSVALLPKLKAAFKSWKSELASLQRPTSTNSVQALLTQLNRDSEEEAKMNI